MYQPAHIRQMNGWERHAVADLLAAGTLYIGDGYRAKNSELAPRGLPFVRGANINDGFQFDDIDRFPEEGLAKVGNKVSQPGDVVFTAKGTVGRFAYVRPDTPRFVYSPQLCFWRSLKPAHIEPRFLYYWMYGREFFLQYNGVKGQTDMADYVSLGDQRRMHITLPPLDDQRAIAHVLGTLDDKIELNRRMNETLEVMARALFKSWFVDFDPVRAKAQGHQPYGMDAETAAIFPDSFEASPLGEVPRGWRVGSLSEIAIVIMGSSPPGDTYNDLGEGVPLVNGPVEFGEFFTVKAKWTTAPTRSCNVGDLIFCVRGSTTGRRVIADDVYCLGRGVCAIRARTSCHSFIYQVINFGLERLLARTSGSVFSNLSGPDISQFETLLPPIHYRTLLNDG